MPAQRAIDCEKAARWTVLTEAKGARRAMERTEYILMWCVVWCVEVVGLLRKAID